MITKNIEQKNFDIFSKLERISNENIKSIYENCLSEDSQISYKVYPSPTLSLPLPLILLGILM